MSKQLPVLGLLLLVAALLSCSNLQKIDVKLANSNDYALKDALIEMPIAEIQAKYADFNSKAIQLVSEDQDIPFQVDDRDGDGAADMLVLVTDLAASGEKVLTLRYMVDGELEIPFSKRTQAEVSHKAGGQFEDKKYIGGSFKNVSFVRVPAEHTDHDTYFRYEGPGWESDKVGYRFYLDWRNATDIFGKKTDKMVLQDVGQDGFDSYHEMADWGMDILKVGSSLGIGSLGQWHEDKVHMVSQTDSITCTIVANGPVYSMIRTMYYGWDVSGDKYDVQSELSIAAGDHKTKHDVQVSYAADNICTGLVKAENVSVLESESDGDWQYFATYGAQSLAGEEDQLGMAILYNKTDLLAKTEDDQSYILVLKPQQGRVTYYFLAAWAQEPGGITDAEQFATYLDEETANLNQPVSYEFD